MVTTFSFAQQDSIRTINDKPGTPQSLRTNNKAPKSQIHFNNNYKPLNQTINHGAVESNKVNNLNNKNNAVPEYNTVQPVPKTPITIVQQPARRAIKNDTTINKGVMSNGQSNATNPIRK